MGENTLCVPTHVEQAIKANLFPLSQRAVESYQTFPWHRRKSVITTGQTNSSQALAIDFFGFLAVCAPAMRDFVCGQIANSLNISKEGPWKVHLEWTDPSNRLGEVKPTQVDALLSSPKAVICVEAKFTEGGGCCSQPNKDKFGRRQCNGNYQLQVNPVNSVRARCALTGKGIHYWDFIPEFTCIQSGTDHVPCPFVGGWYQWMRNMATALVTARAEGKQAGVAVVYADHPSLKMPKLLKTVEWLAFTQGIRTETLGITALSYQSLLDQAMQSGLEDHGHMISLLDWIKCKIEATTRTRLIRLE